MSNCYVTAGQLGGASGTSVYATIPAFKDTLTSAGAADATAALPGGCYIRAVSDGDGWLRFGGTAAVGADYFIPTNGYIDLGPTKEGDVLSFYAAT